MKRITMRMAAMLVLATSAGSASAQENWAIGSGAPRAFCRQGMATLGPILYVFGGIDPATGTPGSDAWAHDPATGSWTAIADFPAALHSMSVAVVGGLVVSAGGEDASGAPVDSVYAYEPVSNTWSPGPALPSPRSRSAGFAALGGLVLAGGRDAAGLPMTSVTRWVAASPGWTDLADLPTPRMGAFAGLSAGQVIVAGGTGSTGLDLADAHRFVIEDFCWVAVSPLPAPAANGGSVTLVNRLLVVGGDSTDLSLLEYDAVLDLWTPRLLPPMNFHEGAICIHPVDATRAIALGGAVSGDTPGLYTAPGYGAVPSAPSGLDQEDSATGAELLIGGTLTGRLVLWGNIVDDDSGLVRLEAEVRGVDEAFRNWPNALGDFVPPTSVSASLPLVGPGAYRWQVRAVDANGNASAWMPFTGPGVAAFRIDAVEPPSPGPVLAPPADATGTSESGRSNGGSCSAAAGAADAWIAMLLAGAMLLAPRRRR